MIEVIKLVYIVAYQDTAIVNSNALVSMKIQLPGMSGTSIACSNNTHSAGVAQIDFEWSTWWSLMDSIRFIL